MPRYTNNSGGTLVLSDRREILAGQEVEITADGAKNVAVARWIEEGKLAGKAPAKTAKD